MNNENIAFQNVLDLVTRLWAILSEQEKNFVARLLAG